MLSADFFSLQILHRLSIRKEKAPGKKQETSRKTDRRDYGNLEKLKSAKQTKFVMHFLTKSL